MPSLTLRRPALPLLAALATTVAPALALADPAAAATRYASATSTLESGACGSDAPCALDHAVGGASSGDEVVVAPGDYFLTASLDPPSGVNLHGAAGQPRPRLVGAPGLADAVIDATGGTFSHLYVESTSDEDALVLHGGTGDDLVLVALHGSAVRLHGSSPTTLLRNSVARAFGDEDAVVLQDGGNPAGATDLRNVTAVSTGGAGVRSKMSRGTATIGNVIARGKVGDVLPAPTGPGTAFDAFSSDFRSSSATAQSTGGDIASEPLFADPANGDFRLSAGSPAIDAGTTDSLVGGTDPDGHPRVLGAAPDMGAFEGAASGAATTLAVVVPWPQPPAGASGEPPLGSLPLTDPVEAVALPAPQPARTVSVAPASGRVTVRRPGGRSFVPLGNGASLPVGAMIDTRKGTVRLVSARDASGTPQTGLFRGGVFQVRQSRRSGLVTTLVLAGGSFRACTAKAAGHGKRRRPHVVRTLWGRDHGGRFQTNGRFAAALVRGTTWETVDRCDGTLIRVTQGRVVVSPHRGRRVTVRAGHSLLVPARRR